MIGFSRLGFSFYWNSMWSARMWQCRWVTDWSAREWLTITDCRRVWQMVRSKLSWSPISLKRHAVRGRPWWWRASREIGKTTLWLAALDQARDRAFQVLSTRTAAVESSLAYASLADLLRGVGATALAALPQPQRVAVDRILLRSSEDGAATDQRAVSAAFLTIVEMLRETSPVLIAIDDLQWLDFSSRHVVAFAARRLGSGVGMLGTFRTEAKTDTTWSSSVRFSQPDAVERIHLGALSLGALHAMVSERLGRCFTPDHGTNL